MNSLQQLVDTLQVSQQSEHQFQGKPSRSDFHVYGGLILTQAIDAARQCCHQDYKLQSLHGHFLRPGIVKEPIAIAVEVLKEGRRFNLYNVSCQQQGKTIFYATVTFYRPEDSFSHTREAPELSIPPEEDATLFMDRTTPLKEEQEPELAAIEVRIKNPNKHSQPLKPEQTTWFNTLNPEAFTLSDWQQTLLLAYYSDWNMPTTALRPHTLSEQQTLKIASVDHSIWFYQQAQLNDWVAHIQDSPAALASRGHSRGLFFSKQGELLACVNQESFMLALDKD